jgi:hypothetical protein
LLKETQRKIRDKAINNNINNDTIFRMADIDKIVAMMRRNPKGIRFHDLCLVCDYYFGQARQSGSSHRIYRTLWIGNPRVNIQNDKGKAKAYQVRQVLKAIERLEEDDDSGK